MRITFRTCSSAPNRSNVLFRKKTGRTKSPVAETVDGTEKGKYIIIIIVKDRGREREKEG